MSNLQAKMLEDGAIVLRVTPGHQAYREIADQFFAAVELSGQGSPKPNAILSQADDAEQSVEHVLSTGVAAGVEISDEIKDRIRALVKKKFPAKNF